MKKTFLLLTALTILSCSTDSPLLECDQTVTGTSMSTSSDYYAVFVDDQEIEVDQTTYEYYNNRFTHRDPLCWDGVR